jgi:hypothetical protein
LTRTIFTDAAVALTRIWAAPIGGTGTPSTVELSRSP